MIYLSHFLYAYICTIGFAVVFNVPKEALFKSGLCGAIGWLVFVSLNRITGSVVIATFTASLLIAFVGEVFAIIEKKPITVYIIPGIVPLVPGFKLYHTIFHIIEQNYAHAATYGRESLLIAIAIAGGLSIVLSINTYRRQRRSYKKSRNILG